ncbi:MAG: hypothetical protein RXS42_08405 [Nitrososphaeria archaeon]
MRAARTLQDVEGAASPDDHITLRMYEATMPTSTMFRSRIS